MASETVCTFLRFSTSFFKIQKNDIDVFFCVVAYVYCLDLAARRPMPFVDAEL